MLGARRVGWLVGAFGCGCATRAGLACDGRPGAPCGASRCVCSSKAKRLAARLSVRSGRTDAGSIRPRSSGISADRPDRPRRGGGAENKSGAVRVPLAVVSLLCDPHLGGGHSPLWANAEGGKERVKREKTGRGTGSEGRRRRESRRLFICIGGEPMGCAGRGAPARRTGSALRAGRVAGSRPDCGPERGERDCWARWPGAGLAARPPASGGSSRPRRRVGRRWQDNHGGGGAWLGGGCIRRVRKGPQDARGAVGGSAPPPRLVLRRGVWRGGGLGTRWRVAGVLCLQL